MDPGSDASRLPASDSFLRLTRLPKSAGSSSSKLPWNQTSYSGAYTSHTLSTYIYYVYYIYYMWATALGGSRWLQAV